MRFDLVEKRRQLAANESYLPDALLAIEEQQSTVEAVGFQVVPLLWIHSDIFDPPGCNGQRTVAPCRDHAGAGQTFREHGHQMPILIWNLNKAINQHRNVDRSLR